MFAAFLAVIWEAEMGRGIFWDGGWGDFGGDWWGFEFLKWRRMFWKVELVFGEFILPSLGGNNTFSPLPEFFPQLPLIPNSSLQRFPLQNLSTTPPLASTKTERAREQSISLHSPQRVFFPLSDASPPD